MPQLRHTRPYMIMIQARRTFHFLFRTKLFITLFFLSWGVGATAGTGAACCLLENSWIGDIIPPVRSLPPAENSWMEVRVPLRLSEPLPVGTVPRVPLRPRWCYSR